MRKIKNGRQRGEINKALELYNYSIKHFPDKPEAYCNLGVMLADIGKTKDAEIKVKQAIELKKIIVNAVKQYSAPITETKIKNLLKKPAKGGIPATAKIVKAKVTAKI